MLLGVRVISVIKRRGRSKKVDELFCKSKTSSEWLYFGSDVENVTRTPESKVQSYLMTRYNLDIKWDGKILGIIPRKFNLTKPYKSA